jgi:hypothetical protein
MRMPVRPQNQTVRHTIHLRLDRLPKSYARMICNFVVFTATGQGHYIKGTRRRLAVAVTEMVIARGDEEGCWLVRWRIDVMAA